MNTREMKPLERHMVTGAFGYSGQAIARKLLQSGMEVRTLTGHPNRPNPFNGQIQALPFNFHDPDALTRSLEGTRVLYNTYWVRFDHGKSTHEQAVTNTKVLIDAARKAGVERFVHVSITNPSIDSPLPYFNGKARLEQYLMASGLSYAILRPAVLFGGRDVLINNIAWMLRALPVFGAPGDGRYSLRPIHVEDQADLAITQGASRDNVVIDAVGPEQYTYDDLVRKVAEAIGRKARILHLPWWMVFVTAKLFGWMKGDVVLTWDEIAGLTSNLLASDQSTGTVRLSEWLKAHADTLGTNYACEIERHYR